MGIRRWSDLAPAWAASASPERGAANLARAWPPEMPTWSASPANCAPGRCTGTWAACCCWPPTGGVLRDNNTMEVRPELTHAGGNSPGAWGRGGPELRPLLPATVTQPAFLRELTPKHSVLRWDVRPSSGRSSGAPRPPRTRRVPPGGSSSGRTSIVLLSRQYTPRRGPAATRRPFSTVTGQARNSPAIMRPGRHLRRARPRRLAAPSRRCIAAHAGSKSPPPPNAHHVPPRPSGVAGHHGQRFPIPLGKPGTRLCLNTVRHEPASSTPVSTTAGNRHTSEPCPTGATPVRAACAGRTFDCQRGTPTVVRRRENVPVAE